MRPANIRAYNVAGTKIAKEVTQSKYGASFCIFSEDNLLCSVATVAPEGRAQSIQRTSATPMTWNSFSFRIQLPSIPRTCRGMRLWR